MDTRGRTGRDRRGVAAVLCGLLVAALAAFSPAAPANAADAPGTRYLYRATFTAEIGYDLSVDWDEGDGETRNIIASIAGAMPLVEIKADGHVVDRSPNANTVNVVSASGTGIVKSDRARYVRTCKMSSGKTTGPPTLGTLEGEGIYLMTFALLTLPSTCTDNQGGEPSTQNYELSPLWVTAPDVKLEPGVPSTSFEVEGGIGTDPLTHPEVCPGYIPGQTPSCHQMVWGTVHLELVQKIPSKAEPKPQPKPHPKPQPRPQGATVSPGGKKVTTPVRCPRRCKVTLQLTPLRGGPRLVLPKTFAPAPGRTVRLKVTVPPAKRRLIRAAGGVRIKLTYRLAGDRRYAETRTARL